MTRAGQLWRAYWRTVLQVDSPDGSCGALAASKTPPSSQQEWLFPTEELWVVTAQNPRSRLLTPADNAARHEELRRQLQGASLGHWPVCGLDPDDATWREDGFAVSGMTRTQALKLGESWEQNALFHLTAEHLTLVGVLLFPHRQECRPWAWLELSVR